MTQGELWNNHQLFALVCSLTAHISARALRRAQQQASGQTAEGLALLAREKAYIEEIMEKPADIDLIYAHLAAGKPAA